MFLFSVIACVGPNVQDDTGGDPLADCQDRSFQTDADMQAVVEGNAAFALDLYGELEEGNAFFSPLSISAAFGMTTAGTDGNTRQELLDVLHADIPEERWHAAFGTLLAELEEDRGDCGVQLAVANRLFGQEGFAWESDFLALASDDYHAPIEDLDFVGDPEGSRTYINDWVEDQTEGRIEDLLPEDSISDSTRMVLANAIYFLANWQTQFDPELTATATWNPSGKEVQLMTMEAATFGMVWADSYKAIELPYADGEQSMVIFLPHATDGLSSLELSPEELVNLEFQEQELSLLQVPRFELLDDTNLMAPMMALGVVDAWSDVDADFTRLAAEPGLHIGGAFHKAFIAVDEVGTEAAAATAVVMNDESAGEFFIADHPFLFMIRDTRTNQVLFMGRVVDP